MIDGSEKRNRQLAFELQNLHVCEKRSKLSRVDGTAWVGRERTEPISQKSRKFTG